MKAKTKRWLGIALVAAPVPLLAIVLALYAIVTFILAALGGGTGVAEMATSGGDLRSLAGSIVNVVLGFIGLLSVLGIFIGIPAGIILITLSETDPEVKERRATELQTNPHYKKSL